MNDIEKVIKILKDANRNPNNYISTCGCCMPSENLCFDNQLSMAVCMAISALEHQLTDGWIPVSERLPEENSRVMICNSNGFVNLAEYKNYFGSMKYLQYDNVMGSWHAYSEVIAWQPLPEPWKETV